MTATKMEEVVPLKTDSPRKRVAIPCYLLDEATVAKYKERFSVLRSVVDGPFENDVFLIRQRRPDGDLPLPALLADLEAAGRKSVQRDGAVYRVRNGVHHSAMIPALLPADAPAFVGERLKEPVEMPDGFDEAGPLFLVMLQLFSAWTGLTPRLFGLDSDLALQFSLEGPPGPRELHIYSNAVPSGCRKPNRTVSSIFGIRIKNSGQNVVSPTKGRGVVVNDSEGTPAVQVVGNTFYFLVPVFSSFAEVGDVWLFVLLLAAGWRAWRKAREAKQVETPLKECVALTEKWLDGTSRKIAEDIVNKERTLEECLQAMQVLRTHITLLRGVLRSLEDGRFMVEARGRIKGDLRRLKQDPDIARIAFVDEGLHVETRRIVIAWKGKRYDVGAFVIRLNSFSGLDIWNEAPTHPLGHPHPHIFTSGTMCYGNVTDSIAQLVAEYRYYDAIRHVLRVLKEGYNPASAVKRIEDWPALGEMGSAEPIANLALTTNARTVGVQADAEIVERIRVNPERDLGTTEAT